MNPEIIEVQQGSAVTLPIQCYRRPAGEDAPQYGSTDTLSCEMRQRGVAAPIFAPAADWLTVNPDTGAAQTGYDEGQVEAGWTATQGTALQPGNPYWLNLYRATAADPTNPETIAVLQIKVVP